MEEAPDNKPAERRQFPRYACKGEAEIFASGTLWGWGTVSDISRGGCYVETVHPLPLRTEAGLRLNIQGSRLEMQAIVISTLPLFGMGMAFVVESREQWEELAQFVDRVTATDHSPSELRAGECPKKAQPHMHVALQHLQQAEEALREEMHDIEGHRTRALHLTENAINEVRFCVEGIL